MKTAEEAKEWVRRRKATINSCARVLLKEAEIGCEIAFEDGQKNPKIKQLEWRYNAYEYSAGTPFGGYIIYEDRLDDGYIYRRILRYDSKRIRVYEADIPIGIIQKDAQEHFESQIKQCLEL